LKPRSQFSHGPKVLLPQLSFPDKRHFRIFIEKVPNSELSNRGNQSKRFTQSSTADRTPALPPAGPQSTAARKPSGDRSNYPQTHSESPRETRAPTDLRDCTCPASLRGHFPVGRPRPCDDDQQIMSTLATLEVADHCCTRLDRLTPTTSPRWGRMTAHQMICHLSDAFKVASQEKSVSHAPSPLPRKWIKWVALRTPLPWAHNVPTRPEIKQGSGGTPPGNWDEDLRQLRDLIRAFPSRRDFGPHPMFGPMTLDDWQVWGYRHVDHHYRQFGI
jgi:hypothetical protein